MSREARKFLSLYKKLFNEISAKKQGNNALSIALEKEGVKKMPSGTAPYTRANADGEGGEKDIDEVRRYASDKYDAETAGINEQIRNSQTKLNNMSPVFNSYTPLKVRKAYEAGTWAINELKKYGFHADRQNFGKVYFDETSIRDAMKFLDTDAEKVSIAAIYKVIKQGIQIGEHGNHKVRGKHTITFAAPVIINGTRGNMAVVVNMRNNKYKVHRILMPDGSIFKFEQKNNTEREMQRGVPKRSLADATSSVFDNSVSQKSEKVNTSDKNSSKKRFALPETVEQEVLEKYGRTFSWNTAGYVFKSRL